MAKQTALYETHLQYGGTMVDFAGYSLPIQYPSGIIQEHTAVRQKAGLFDVSHMGELFFTGAAAEEGLNALLANDIRGMQDGQIRYSILPNENGGAVDDVLIYRFHAQKFLMVTNASNHEKDYLHIKEHLNPAVTLDNAAERISQLALQGPLSEEILKGICPEDSLPVKNYWFTENVDVGGVPCLVSKTGYTGESGYELYTENARAAELYAILMARGQAFGLIPAGLGARDTLRLEAGMPLYGHELRDEYKITETALDFSIKLQKERFLGKEALLAYEPRYMRIGAVALDRGIVREGAVIYAGETEAGIVTSGTFSPSLGKSIMQIRLLRSAQDAALTAEVRGKKIAIQAAKLPFKYKPEVSL